MFASNVIVCIKGIFTFYAETMWISGIHIDKKFMRYFSSRWNFSTKTQYRELFIRIIVLDYGNDTTNGLFIAIHLSRIDEMQRIFISRTAIGCYIKNIIVVYKLKYKNKEHNMINRLKTKSVLIYY